MPPNTVASGGDQPRPLFTEAGAPSILSLIEASPNPGPEIVSDAPSALPNRPPLTPSLISCGITRLHLGGPTPRFFAQRLFARESKSPESKPHCRGYFSSVPAKTYYNSPGSGNGINAEGFAKHPAANTQAGIVTPRLLDWLLENLTLAVPRRSRTRGQDRPARGGFVQPGEMRNPPERTSFYSPAFSRGAAGGCGRPIQFLTPSWRLSPASKAWPRRGPAGKP